MNDEPEKKSLAPEYFEGVYDADDDPWNFTTSRYEAEKYDATVNALPREHYESAFEIGCSIGVLTARLAAKCEMLRAIDVNEKAVRQARERCANLSNVRIEKMEIPKQFPVEKFDLIVVSEVGYYLSVEDWRTAQEKILAHLHSKGSVILVHWTHFVDDYPQTGDAVHDSFAEFANGQAELLKAERTADYRLDVWEKL